MRKIIAIILIGILIFLFNVFENNEHVNESKVIDKKELISVSNKYSKDDIIDKLGEPNRIDKSEYEFEWYIYNQLEEGLLMIGMEYDEVVAVYTNSDKFVGKFDINDVREKYVPLEYKQKDNIKFNIKSNDEYDIILENNKYITIFYDKHNDNKVTSILAIDEIIENKQPSIYTNKSNNKIDSFEKQMVDLINSTRRKYDLKDLSICQSATIAAKNHSQDMIENNYFDHINKNNETPFDRMKNQSITYKAAAENIAAGQISSIYAHEALMNSKGHRENILGDYNYIGSGVEFGGEYQIYYTQKFYK